MKVEFLKSNVYGAEMCIVSKSNQPERIAYEDEEGRHLRLHKKYDLKAADRIKKRHEEEVKRHE